MPRGVRAEIREKIREDTGAYEHDAYPLFHGKDLLAFYVWPDDEEIVDVIANYDEFHGLVNWPYCQMTRIFKYRTQEFIKIDGIQCIPHWVDFFDDLYGGTLADFCDGVRAVYDEWTKAIFYVSGKKAKGRHTLGEAEFEDMIVERAKVGSCKSTKDGKMERRISVWLRR